jgi:tRNA(His) 5'-end guanylyltransferase
MKVDDLDKKLRIYETSHDLCVLPELYIVARIDGRSFSKLTKKKHKFKLPFDDLFKDYMVETTIHLMNCGFNVIYGYTESDEISLLFDFNETTFSRKHQKFTSILAGEASAKFSTLIGSVASFDCRLSELPNQQLVVDYFRWRNEDAHRNALNAYCYWKLREDNYSKQEATKKIEKASTADKNELLFTYGINFNNIPKWQKRGIGLFWTEIEKEVYNPKTKEKSIASRRQLQIDFELPMKDEYDAFILEIIKNNENKISK